MSLSTSAENGAGDEQHLWAVAAAVRAAVTHDVDGSGDGDRLATEVTNVATLKAYVESYLDGYTVSAESLSAAIDEGPALTAGTLKELISQATVTGLDVDEFFADGDIDIEAGLASAARYAPGTGPGDVSVRDQLFALLQLADDAGEWIFVKPDEVWATVGVHEVARQHIIERGLPATTPYIGWGGSRDVLRPDGSFKKGEDCLEVFWRGDAEIVRAHLRSVEALGYVVEGGSNGTRFRLVPADDPSSAEPYAMPERDDLLSDRSQTGATRYATTWVEKTHRPKNDSDYLTEEEASNLYSERKAFFVFPEPSDLGVPAWSMKVSPGKKVVVTHYHHPAASVARIIEFTYSPIHLNNVFRGSLRRDVVTDYFWADDQTAYATKTRAVGKVILRGVPGVPEMVHEDGLTGASTVTKHRDGPAGRLAVSYPVFGDWGPIVDPWIGETDEPRSVPRLRIDDAWAEREREVWAEDGPIASPNDR